MQTATDSAPDIHDVIATLQQQVEKLQLVNEELVQHVNRLESHINTQDERLTNQEQEIVMVRQENRVLLERIDGMEGRIDRSNAPTKQHQPPNQAIQKGTKGHNFAKAHPTQACMKVRTTFMMHC